MATRTKSRKGSALATAGLDDEQLKRMLHLLKLCRYFDERMEALYRQGRLPGAIYSGRGQEGTHVGVTFAPSTRTPGMPYASARSAIVGTGNSSRFGVEYAN